MEMKGICLLTKYWEPGEVPLNGVSRRIQTTYWCCTWRPSRKRRHSGHNQKEYLLQMDGKEAVVAALAGSTSVGASQPAVARSLAISMEMTWGPKTAKAPFWVSNILQTSYKRDRSQRAVGISWVKTVRYDMEGELTKAWFGKFGKMVWSITFRHIWRYLESLLVCFFFYCRAGC